METLELLGTALGLATLAGINLYLTVFVSGLAIQQGWITLHPQLEQLAVLGDPVIVTIAGILFALEFFADKVPWVDTVWDSVHSFIRPVGGAMLAITALGDVNPVYDVVVGLLAGGMAFTTHGAKAGTRLLANASPEPLSNVGLSLAEDATVLGGLAVVYSHPIVALGVSLFAVGLIIWLAPRLFRKLRAMLWLLWRRVCGSAVAPAIFKPELPQELEIALARNRGEGGIEWAAPCVTGRGETIKANTFGWLLLSSGESGGLDFARRVDCRPLIQAIELVDRKILHRRGFISDQVVIYERVGGRRETFQFDHSRRKMAEEFARRLIDRSKLTPATVIPAAVPGC